MVTSCLKWRVPFGKLTHNGHSFSFRFSFSCCSLLAWHLKFMQPTLLSHMQMMFVDDPWKYLHTHTHLYVYTYIYTHPVRHIQFNIPYTKFPLFIPSRTPFTFSTSFARCCRCRRLIFIHFSHDNDAYYEFFVISLIFFPLFFYFSCISFHIFNISSTLPFPSNRNNLHAA